MKQHQIKRKKNVSTIDCSFVVYGPVQEDFTHVERHKGPETINLEFLKSKVYTGISFAVVLIIKQILILCLNILLFIPAYYLNRVSNNIRDI